MPTFGGLSFTNNTTISDFLDSIAEHFLEMVACHSIFLKCDKNQEEILRLAKFHSYPRIGFCLAAAKKCDDTFLFADPADPTSLPKLYENVINIMTDPDSPFAEGITAIAAGFTAVKLIRQLPINGELKNVDVAQDFEDSYRKELEKLLDLYCKTDSPAPAIVSTTNQTCEVGSSLYFSFAIDKDTLPPATFDQGDLNTAVVIPDGTVRTYDDLYIESGKIAFAYIYLSSVESDTASLRARSKAVRLRLHDSLDKIINLISITINQLTLADTGQIEANIIASPFLTHYNYKNITQIKKNLYPEISGFYDPKKAQFNLLNQIAYLNFDARRLSPIVNRELVLIDFYQLDIVEALNTVLGNDTAYNYSGIWDTNFTYRVNDVVEHEGEIYIATNPSTGIDPTDINSWQLVVFTSDALDGLRPIAENGIPGLNYGTCASYCFLDCFGPKSLILDVEKGNVRSSSTTSDPGTTDDEEDLCVKFPPDVMFFRIADGVPFVSGQIKIAISSVCLKDCLEIDHLLDINGYLTVTLNQATSISQIIFEINRALFAVSKKTGILAANIKGNALQFIAYKPSVTNIKHVVEIVAVPQGLEIALGNIYKVCCEYLNAPRSLPLTVQREGALPEPEEPEEETPSLRQAAAATQYRAKSSCLISVAEKLKRFC